MHKKDNVIVGVGIDTVSIERFDNWHTYSTKQLLRVFSQAELDYAFSHPVKTAERLAGRFALKEACFKALSPLSSSIPFLTLCRAVSLDKSKKSPVLKIRWGLFEDSIKAPEQLKIHCSLSHTAKIATGIVIIEAKMNQSLTI